MEQGTNNTRLSQLMYISGLLQQDNFVSSHQAGIYEKIGVVMGTESGLRGSIEI